ncbi:DNA-3-methyladenine glycosylase, partial [Candidatus Woesearchaeota archaeon]|nr:DNA-3-methyladenine glycosylase [Candidatus Woesearchaeota archaeon]
MNYRKKAKEVAKELIGKKIEANGLVAEIVETEAYEGGEQTARRGCMRLAPGQIGVMPYRGLHFLNIGTKEAGTPSCVLVRAVMIDDEIVDGPGRVGKRLDASS